MIFGSNFKEQCAAEKRTLELFSAVGDDAESYSHSIFVYYAGAAMAR
jgi:hypothetical protein